MIEVGTIDINSVLTILLGGCGAFFAGLVAFLKWQADIHKKSNKELVEMFIAESKRSDERHAKLMERQTKEHRVIIDVVKRQNIILEERLPKARGNK